MHYLIWIFLCFWFLEAVCWEKSSTKFLCTYAQILMLINYKLQSRTDLAYFTFWEKEKWFPKYTCGNLIFSPIRIFTPMIFAFYGTVASMPSFRFFPLGLRDFLVAKIANHNIRASRQFVNHVDQQRSGRGGEHMLIFQNNYKYVRLYF